MKAFGLFLIAGVLTVGAQTLPDRWVMLPCNFWGSGEGPHSLGHFTNVVARAKAAGYNGVTLSAHFDMAHQWPKHLTNQVLKAKAFCDAVGMEIIPWVWDVGYAGDCPGNWYESRTIEDLPYVRRGAKAVFEPAPVVVSGGPCGHMAFAGTDAGRMPMRPARTFTLKKGSRYVVSLRVRSTGVPERDRFQFIGFIPSVKGRSSYYAAPKLAHDGAWHDVVYPLEAKTDEPVTMVFGHWGKTGTVEMADFKVVPRGIVGVTRRPGIPFVVKDAESGRIYTEGRDYAEVPPLAIRNEGAVLGPYLELAIPSGSRIAEGARLLATADIPNLFHTGGHDQYAACMSNEDWYRRAEKSAQAVNTLLQPKKWFLCFDELRSANTCAACRARKLDMAHLIADCLARQREIVRRVNPSATCYVWGDMLDPNHNANAGYAHTVGSYEGIAKLIPQDLVICPWYGERALEQADYWAANGFRMIAGAYYDDRKHAHDRRWLEASKRHPDNFTGFMFCTWRNDFSELEAFAKLMFGAAAQP